MEDEGFFTYSRAGRAGSAAVGAGFALVLDAVVAACSARLCECWLLCGAAAAVLVDAGALLDAVLACAPVAACPAFDAARDCFFVVES